ncbi:YjcZ family sporulation protein [Siminovitchia terrae]
MFKGGECHVSGSYGSGYSGGGMSFILIVVLFILLIIVGASFMSY